MSMPLHCGWCLPAFIVLFILGTRPSHAQLVPLTAPPVGAQPTQEIDPADYQYAERLSQLVKRVAKQSTESVVHIEAEKRERKQGRTEEFEEAGSGVIVQLSKGVYVLTNRHVIHGANANDIIIRLNDGREFHPQAVVDDAATDVAIIRIDAAGVIPAKMGDSTKMEIGDFVIAIGSPFGLSHSVTFGILSAMGRRSLTLGEQAIDIQDFFQTDAAINPGNSGGPLLNLRGEVIGLNTAIASSSGGSEGIGFAIPINMALRVAEQLAANGKLQRAFLGVTLDKSFGAEKARAKGLNRLAGAHVTVVSKPSPAALAGIEVGDVVLSFDGVSIENDDHLVAVVGLTEVGRTVPMVILRQGQQYSVSVTLTPRDH